MAESLISNEKVCKVCGWPLGLHKHHIFFGRANRPLSEKYGCWVWLCQRHHTESPWGVHHDRQLDLKLKRQAQEGWEQRYGNREDFIRTFGRSYL